MVINFEAYNLPKRIFLELSVPYSEESFAKVLSLPNTRNIRVERKRNAA